MQIGTEREQSLTHSVASFSLVFGASSGVKL